jgi:TnsA endonuclease N terminal
MSIYTEIQRPLKSKGGRPKGSKNKNPYPVTEAVRQAARDRMAKLTPKERSARAAYANKFAGTPEERVTRIAYAKTFPLTEAGREALRQNRINMNKTPKMRASTSARMKGKATPGSGRKKGSKNSRPLPRESYLHLKPPRATPESSKKSGLSRRGRKHSAEHCEALRQSNIKRIENGTFKVVSSMKGKFRPNHPERYDGDPTEIIYRSQWECKFMSYLDNNSAIISWNSESTIVPYFDPSTSKWRRYFPDFLVVIKKGDGTLTQMIEIKPASQCVPPKVPTKKTRRFINESLTYITNQAKFSAAESYCKDRGWVFKVITEKDLFTK